MAAPLIVSVSGIRGIVGESLTAETALAFARAYGTYLEGRPVIVSRDGRPSGELLRDAVAAGLMSAGCDVYHLSIQPTPTVGLAVRTLQAAGAVQLTASHNPAEYNGLKLFGPSGMVLTAAEGARVLDVYRAQQFRTADWRSVGVCRTVETNPTRDHAQQVIGCVDTAAIKRRRFKIFLDANGGAGGPLGQFLLVLLGCDLVRAGCEPDGQFRHPPEPTEANTAAVARQVAEAHCDLGAVLDPDADRLALIDETGRYVGEELTLGLAAAFRLRQQAGPVVINMSTSRLVEDLAARHGCPCHRTPVGEAHVAGAMRELGAVIGGEGNGGVIDPRVGWVRDPFIGLALVLNALAVRGQKLSAAVAELPAYHIVKDKYTVPAERLPGLYDRLRGRWADARADGRDGLRLDWADRWVHVRPSNTEPIVRVIAEAPEPAAAAALCAEVGALVAALG